jgi:8-oxo-dGTP pyrophosphatase MutT (NUDIX family)
LILVYYGKNCGKKANSKKFLKEYKASKDKFDILKSNNFYGLLDNENLSKYLETEWEFPKGRKNLNENNLDRAIREFTEETNISCNKIQVLERLNYLEEDFKGTNDINYKNIFYLASTDNLLHLSTNINNYEISDIKWFTIPEAIKK